MPRAKGGVAHHARKERGERTLVTEHAGDSADLAHQLHGAVEVSPVHHWEGRSWGDGRCRHGLQR